jgi:hypothetical protein
LGGEGSLHVYNPSDSKQVAPLLSHRLFDSATLRRALKKACGTIHSFFLGRSRPLFPSISRHEFFNAKRVLKGIYLGVKSFWLEQKSFWFEQKSFYPEQKSFWFEQKSFYLEQKSFWFEQKSFWFEQKSFYPEQKSFYPEQKSFYPEQKNRIRRFSVYRARAPNPCSALADRIRKCDPRDFKSIN